ncbi:DUF4276 family protein [Spirosoma sp. HMF4905]|uniref:DUF4276 family protein n=1 Tax=Spirosoma arboris TaxID=2682092 RepID=A0A7K1SMR0_9BACT|nr:DUF4276 family protein [Spirosoma arboris]MVM35082.1 DUF4276 family protein [Spirosoma arboris]
MKPPLVYALIAEGFAEYSFIPVYVKRLATQKGLQIKRSSLDLLKKQPSKSKVLQEAEELCLKALRDEEQAFCIVGIDLDGPDQTDEQKEHTLECTKLHKALGSAYKRYQEQIIVYVPIQAIEHWLAYQAYQLKINNKPNNDSLEKLHQKDLKRLLYGDKDDGRKMRSIAQAIAEKADFNELAKQSRSFAHFHKQIIAFLDQYSKQK